MRNFKPVEFNRDVQLPNGFSARFLPGGHILGAAIVELTGDGKKIVFSGDLGRPNSATMLDPTIVTEADYLLVEFDLRRPQARHMDSKRRRCSP